MNTKSIISLLLIFLGFLDATYLTIIHYTNTVPPCSLAHGCETVLNSSYATIGPIPLALIGSAYYVALIGLLLTSAQTKHSLSYLIYKTLTTAGLIVSIILVCIQAFILHAFCQYCLGVEAINTILFAFLFI